MKSRQIGRKKSLKNEGFFSSLRSYLYIGIYVSRTIHLRHIETDTGWKISFDRGLDVYQHFGGYLGESGVNIYTSDDFNQNLHAMMVDGINKQDYSKVAQFVSAITPAVNTKVFDKQRGQ